MKEFVNEERSRPYENSGVIKSEEEEKTTKPRVHNGFLGWQDRYRESRRRIHRQEVRGAITNHPFKGLGRRVSEHHWRNRRYLESVRRTLYSGASLKDGLRTSIIAPKIFKIRARGYRVEEAFNAFKTILFLEESLVLDAHWNQMIPKKRNPRLKLLLLLLLLFAAFGLKTCPKGIVPWRFANSAASFFRILRTHCQCSFLVPTKHQNAILHLDIFKKHK